MKTNMTPNAIAQGLSHQEVGEIVAEALEWRRKGVLNGGALRRFANRLVTEAGISEHDSVRMADSLIIEEAAARYVAHI